MAAAIAIMFVLPWLVRNPVKSILYKGNSSRVAIEVFQPSLILFGVSGVGLPRFAGFDAAFEARWPEPSSELLAASPLALSLRPIDPTVPPVGLAGGSGGAGARARPRYTATATSAWLCRRSGPHRFSRTPAS